MTQKASSEFKRYWHQIRREQRRIEEEFVHSFLDEATPDNAITLLDSMPSDAQDAVLHHLGGTRRDYWSDIGTVGIIPYDPDAETPEDKAARFLETIEVVLSSKQRKDSE